MQETDNFTSEDILKYKSVKHAQDANHPGHTLCGMPLKEVRMWSVADCCVGTTCPKCRAISAERRLLALEGEQLLKGLFKEKSLPKKGPPYLRVVVPIPDKKPDPAFSPLELWLMGCVCLLSIIMIVSVLILTP